MTNLLDKLAKATKTLNEEEIINNLKTILAQGTDIELSNSNLLKDLLKINKNEIIKLLTEVIAEWAKIKTNRDLMTNEEIINTVLSFLGNADVDVIFNAVRALGNICYENEEACNIIDKAGIHTILSILKKDSEREDKSLTIKTAGLLVNLFNLHDGLPRTALKNDIIPIIEKLLMKYFKPFEENQMLLTFLLSILNNLSDYFDEQNIPFSENLCQIVADIFKISTSTEISVICLEIFHNQSERDEIKSLLAKEGVCELLFDLIEKNRDQVNDEESRSVLKMACDLIVIILTGDDCMYMLYKNGEGKVYLNMTTWLDSDDSDLLSTGILAIGNFARKDLHCIQMVKNGISKKLINLLSKYNTSVNVSDVKIQHALLSTLKNIVIPQPNKAQVLQEGLIEVIYPMIKIDQYIVVFKLLGTFRMVIDGQESAALDLISRVDFLERLVYWCYNSDHLGVRGEVPRLLSWLIKHCHSFKPLKTILSVKCCVKCIVDMISSNHAVMQNEAFYALNLLNIGCTDSNSGHNDNLNDINYDSGTDLETFVQEIINADIGKNLNFVINKYGDKMDKQTIENLLTLLEQLIKSKPVTEHFRLTDVQGALKKISANPNIQSVSDKYNSIVSEITK